MRFNFSISVLSIVLVMLLQGCVTAKKYNDKEALANRFLEQRDRCKEDLKEALYAVETLEEQNKQLSDSLNSVLLALRNEESLLVDCREQVSDIQKTNTRLQGELEDLALTAGQREADYLLKLNEKEKVLQEKEDVLADRQKELEEMRQGLLAAKQRAKDLEQSIRKKDSTVAAIRDKISGALKGFDSDELTIDSRDGKIYVSLAEKLLFASGKYKVEGDKGRSALEKLADVVLKQPAISVVVEGHTDSIPYVSSSGSIRNNWDLSVLRATTVTAILVNDFNLPTERIQAAGRGATFPVADNSTEEGRRKNRRIEIILSPDLTALWEIINGE